MTNFNLALTESKLLDSFSFTSKAIRHITRIYAIYKELSIDADAIEKIGSAIVSKVGFTPISRIIVQITSLVDEIRLQERTLAKIFKEIDGGNCQGNTKDVLVIAHDSLDVIGNGLATIDLMSRNYVKKREVNEELASDFEDLSQLINIMTAQTYQLNDLDRLRELIF